MAFRTGKSVKNNQPANEKTIEINAQMEGSLSFQDPVNLKINSNFIGNLETRGTLTIGNSAQVQANISGDSIIIAGQVYGDIVARTMLVLMPTAILKGNIQVRKLNIVEGALFHGNCTMEISEEISENLLDIAEVSKYLEIEIGEIEALAKAGKIPGIRRGDAWKFERDQIDNWATSGRIK